MPLWAGSIKADRSWRQMDDMNCAGQMGSGLLVARARRSGFASARAHVTTTGLCGRRRARGGWAQHACWDQRQGSADQLGLRNRMAATQVVTDSLRANWARCRQARRKTPRQTGSRHVGTEDPLHCVFIFHLRKSEHHTIVTLSNWFMKQLGQTACRCGPPWNTSRRGP